MRISRVNAALYQFTVRLGASHRVSANIDTLRRSLENIVANPISTA